MTYFFISNFSVTLCLRKTLIVVCQTRATEGMSYRGFRLVVTSALTSADVSLTSGSRSPDERWPVCNCSSSVHFVQKTWQTSFECHTDCLLFVLLLDGVSIVNFLSHHEESGLQCIICLVLHSANLRYTTFFTDLRRHVTLGGKSPAECEWKNEVIDIDTDITAPGASKKTNHTVTDLLIKKPSHAVMPLMQWYTGYPFLYFYIFVLLVHIRGSQTCFFQNTTTVADTQYPFHWEVGNQQELFLLRISKKKTFFLKNYFFKKKCTCTARAVVQWIHCTSARAPRHHWSHEDFLVVWSEEVFGKGLTFDFFSEPLVRKDILVTVQCADSIITCSRKPCGSWPHFTRKFGLDSWETDGKALATDQSSLYSWHLMDS